jgi:hypothetical protein
VAVLEPKLADTRPSTPPPPVNIERVLANDVEAVATTGAAKVQVGPGLQRLEIQYGAVSFTSPDRVRFRYRLQGLESSWVDADTRRIVHYYHLPSGDYTFEVKASNSDGVWSTAPTMFAFSVKPFWWQRRPVQFAGLTAGALTVIGATYFRISMLSDMVSNDTKLAGGTVTMVEEIAGCARSSVSALDEIVWAVNPRHDTMDGLLDYVSNYCHGFLEDTGVLLQLALPPHQPAVAINSELRYGILMIIKEALNNVVKHAGPCTLHLTIKTDGHQLGGSIADSGGGFEVAKPKADARSGLTSMTERAIALGGTLEIHAKPGAGTQILFRVPLQKTPAHHHE